MELGETVTYCSLEKGYPCVGATLHSLHAPSDLGGGARSDMNTSHIFSQGALAVITLVGGRAGDGATRARGSVSQGFPSAQWPASPYWGWDWVPRC